MSTVQSGNSGASKSQDAFVPTTMTHCRFGRREKLCETVVCESVVGETVVEEMTVEEMTVEETGM